MVIYVYTYLYRSDRCGHKA